MMQYNAVRCSAIQCVAAFGSVLQRVLQSASSKISALKFVAVYCGVLQCVAACCSMLRYVAERECP